jgi:hypothetical protein
MFDFVYRSKEKNMYMNKGDFFDIVQTTLDDLGFDRTRALRLDKKKAALAEIKGRPDTGPLIAKSGSTNRNWDS